MTHYIYILEFKDGSFYIGQTINIKRRFYQHYKSFGTTFTHVVIDECDSKFALLFECMWMQLFLTWGFRVKNGRPWRNVNFNQKTTAGIKRGPIRTIRTIRKEVALAIPKEYQLRCPNCKILLDNRNTGLLLLHNVYNNETFGYECPRRWGGKSFQEILSNRIIAI